MRGAPGRGGEDPPRRLQPVEPGHADVHQHDVGLQLLGEPDRAMAVLRLGGDLDVVLGLEDHAQAAADQALVVGDQHPDHDGVRSSGRRARSA